LPDLSRMDCVGNISYWSNVLEGVTPSPVYTEDVIAFRRKAVAEGEEHVRVPKGAGSLFLSRDKQLGRRLQELAMTFLLASALGEPIIVAGGRPPG
jgi:hypothetical protein